MNYIYRHLLADLVSYLEDHFIKNYNFNQNQNKSKNIKGILH